MVPTKSLVEIIHERIHADAVQLPVFHHVALRLLNILSKEDFSIAQVAQMITEDQALASHVLRMANSAFFGGLSKVTTIRDAVVRLGARQVTNIVTLVTQSYQYRAKDKLMAAYMQTLWKHAMGCALGAKWFVDKIGYKDLAQEALLAGLLHDIGQLFLLKVLDDIQASEPQVQLSKQVIFEVLQQLHVEQGTILMQQWNLPDMYAEVVHQHHEETYDTSNTLLTVVRLVDMACRKVGIGIRHEPSLVLAAEPEAQILGAKEVVLAELEIMLEDAISLST
ncbi:MAG: HDOD domain-containing protein [Candidatus Tectimicrobiota bacterium]